MSPDVLAARLAALLKHAATHADRLPQAVSEGAAWLAAGAPLASPETLAGRERVCHACDYWRPIAGTSATFHCAVCKCLALKLALTTSRCPLGKWLA